jgi:hypothetical protein
MVCSYILMHFRLFIQRKSCSCVTRHLCHKYEGESKSNLNMAIKSQNHVVDGCTIDMLCPPA